MVDEPVYEVKKARVYHTIYLRHEQMDKLNRYRLNKNETYWQIIERLIKHSDIEIVQGQIIHRREL